MNLYLYTLYKMLKIVVQDYFAKSMYTKTRIIFIKIKAVNGKGC